MKDSGGGQRMSEGLSGKPLPSLLHLLQAFKRGSFT